MAEIKIEKKKKIWPWIIIIIIVAVLAFLYFYGSTSDDDVENNTQMEEIGQIHTSRKASDSLIFKV
ncbi:hypothetical protein [Zunongwangia sp. HGR-M22]|uniref:hypothetical protein n=1 Tax=Zunongwangia sp. HGR-M22 TaxID=3015168 RepID=UPI0022DD0B0C|nr:hypothetical protein [Zunongwangia sp. HGR-M22]WBL27129.1 hypothetical protein PBT91_07605 [Zunongwangia sp. HGR-M22]